MIKFENFTETEIANAMLLIIQEIAENNISVSTPQIMKDCKTLGQDWINIGFQVLLDKQYITAEKKADGCFYDCKLTQAGLDYLQSNENKTLYETAMLVLQKTYEWYIRNNYVMDTQEDSRIVSYSLGINNHEKVRNAINMFIENGLLRKWVVMRDFTSFCITIAGVNFMEQKNEEESKKEQSANQIVINGNSGNIAIGSENVAQSVNANELNQAFERLENLINEKLEGVQKQEALDEVEMSKELSNSQHPKWNLVKKAIGRLGVIPALCESVKTIMDLINQFR